MRIWTTLSARLDIADAEKLQDIAGALNLTPSDAVRLLIRTADVDVLVADYKLPDRRGKGYHRRPAERRREAIADLARRLVAGAEAEMATSYDGHTAPVPEKSCENLSFCED